MNQVKLFLTAAGLLLGACTTLQPNIQRGNASGHSSDNRWDYFDGTPVHYTSSVRTLQKGDATLLNEKTDRFSGTLSVQTERRKAYITFNGTTIDLIQFSDPSTKEQWLRLLLSDASKRARYADAFSDWFQDDRQRYLVAFDRKRQMLLSAYKEDDDRLTSIAYYPSRYLACKKVAAIAKAHNEAVVAQLVSTGLVAGLQSYTSYSTARVYDSYGNFGYATVRDWSWAGDRGADALAVLFNGGKGDQQIQSAWSALNCY